MVDTNRSKADLAALLADNTTALISAQDVRDFLESVFTLATKGDLTGIDAAGLRQALSVSGNDGWVLTEDAASTLGFKWATSGAGHTEDHDHDGAPTQKLLAANTHESPSADTHHAQSHAHNGADSSGTVAGSDLTGTPGGELGGTWASPTVDATHSGSTHSAATDTHIADGTDAHAASAITNTPAGTVAATTVQAAIDELATDYAAADSSHAGAADPHTGYMLESLLDAKGDLISASADNTPIKLTVGADDTILMADAAAASGLKWVASASPSAVGTAAATGTADTFTRGDHVHAHEAAHINHDTTWAAKGDLIAGTANDTAQVLGVGANNTVVIAASGETTGLKYDYVYDELTLTVENPTASENIIMRQFTQAITITAIQATVIGGTSVTIDPEHGSTVTTATKLLSAAEVVASANTSGEHIGGTGTAMAATFNDATLAAGDYLRLETTAISGVPTQLSITIKYRLT